MKKTTLKRLPNLKLIIEEDLTVKSRRGMKDPLEVDLEDMVRTKMKNPLNETTLTLTTTEDQDLDLETNLQDRPNQSEKKAPPSKIPPWLTSPQRLTNK